MRPTKIPVVLQIGLASLAVLLTGGCARAQSSLAGIYTCARAEVAGRMQRCAAPSFELKSDGSYQMLAERGTYEVIAGRWLVLSASKNHGKARLDGGKEIVFEFTSHGRKNKIVYRRKFQRAPGAVAI
jgi:hypothetical protein